MKYQALLTREHQDSGFTRKIETLNTEDLPQNGTLIRVYFAGLNFKDALSATGNKGVTRKFPHTPGIDACGEIVETDSTDFAIGEKVIVTSYDLGMNTFGGFGQYINVPSSWIIKLPENFSPFDSMVYGTAGFTAALALYKMELNGQTPEMGPILVTGASGGVGSLAVAILAKAGYEVIASTGKAKSHAYLKKLGATEIIDRESPKDDSKKPMLSSRWAGIIDTVGGETLAGAIKSLGPNGNVAVCGLVGSPFYQTSVFPLIIRGVNILGVESAECGMPIRKKVWANLAGKWAVPQLEEIGKEISLEELSEAIDLILAGKTQGRLVVKHQL